ncbi:hypothetical protein QX776_08155 [Alteromonadaceae bacterium BrNp21-10]|nr:hypothetical protein [Alteromonadaceae bacterium BrNp21-10]
MLLIAGLLTLMIGLVHSYLGERYILIRLFKRDGIPHLFGSDVFTKQTLRFAWHITTIAWWGLAAIMFTYANSQAVSRQSILQIIAVVFLISGLIALIASKGKHLSWLCFFVIAGGCLMSLDP